MDTPALLSLEDIAEALPPYHEVLSVEMDPVLEEAYSKLEDALWSHREGLDRDYGLEVILQEGPPGLRRRFRSAHHV